jgi:hypothetical protein
MDRSTFWLHVDEMRSCGSSVGPYVGALDDDDQERFLLRWLDLTLQARRAGLDEPMPELRSLVLEGRRAFAAATAAATEAGIDRPMPRPAPLADGPQSGNANARRPSE